MPSNVVSPAIAKHSHAAVSQADSAEASTDRSGQNKSRKREVGLGVESDSPRVCMIPYCTATGPVTQRACSVYGFRLRRRRAALHQNAGDHLKRGLAKRRQVLGLAAGDEVVVHHHFLGKYRD